jgi:hypothetical protein
MIRLGVVAAGPTVRIADGTQASAGDLILCTRNDHTVHARDQAARWPTVTCSASSRSPPQG